MSKELLDIRYHTLIWLYRCIFQNIDHFITKTLPDRLELLEAWLAPNENSNKKQRWHLIKSRLSAAFPLCGEPS